jgi:hypothetical protein
MVSTHILRFIYPGSKLRRPPLARMKFLHERRVAARIARSSHKAKLIGFFVGQFAGSRQNAPRCSVALRVLTPSGMPAVKLHFGAAVAGGCPKGNINALKDGVAADRGINHSLIHPQFHSARGPGDGGGSPAGFGVGSVIGCDGS